MPGYNTSSLRLSVSLFPLCHDVAPSLLPSLAKDPLDPLVDIRHGTGPSVVNHKNITRVIDVYAGVASGHDVGSVVADLEDRLGVCSQRRPSL